MPTRRTTLAAIGALSVGGASAVATGAFSTATAERDVATEFEGDATAVLAFQPTSRYAAIDDEDGIDVLSIDFSDSGDAPGLSARADFTFQDTFRVVNNGTNTVAPTDVGSADDDEDWNNENDESEEAGRVLISRQAGAWQGTPNEDYVSEEVEDFDDIGTNVGQFPARSLDGLDDNEDIDEGDIALEPGEWISFGFRFQGTNGVGDWEPDDIPDTLQLEFNTIDNG